MPASGWSLCDDESEQPDVDTPRQLLHPSLLVDQLSQLQTCDKHVQVVHRLAQLIAGDKTDIDGLLSGAQLRKPELLVQARLVLLDNRADLMNRRDALLLLQWCAAQQPLAPAAKVKEEVQYYTSLAQHGPFPQTKLWASAALVMLACQPAIQLLVIGDEGSAHILASLMREALMQPNVQLHILAQCTRFIAHVTSLPGQEQLLQLCIHQLTEPLLLLLGEGGATAVEACGALVALIRAQPQAAAAAVGKSAAAAGGEGAKTSRCGVAAVVAALERELGELAAAPAAVESRQAAGAAAAEVAVVEDSAFSAAGDEAVQGSLSVASGSEGQGHQEGTLLPVGQPLSCGGQPPTCLSASLLALLRRLLEQAGFEAACVTQGLGVTHAAMGSALSHKGTVSLLVRCLQLGSQEGGADAMRCLAVLLREPQARDQLLAAEGAVDEVASHWRLAPAAAARALWHMRENLQSSSQCEALLQLLGHPAGPAPPAPSDEDHARRFGDTLQCVKCMVAAGRWGPCDQAAAATPALLGALDLAHSNLGQLTPGWYAPHTLMELWALLSSNSETALQLALGAEAPAADGTASSLPCCVSAAMDQLQQETALLPSSPLSPHLALMLNLLRAACVQQQQPPAWVRQLQGSFLTALNKQLKELAPEPADLQALLLCTQLSALRSSNESLCPQLQLLTPQMLQLGTSSTDPQAQSETTGRGVQGPAAAAAWSPLDVLQSKLGLLQRLMDHNPAAGDSGVLPLLLHLLLNGPLAADSPPPPSDYSPLLGATPDSMRRQVLQLIRQAAEGLPMGSRTWSREELQRALDAASSCKAGQPRKQELANCVALVALWLDLQLQGDVEQMDDMALEQHLQSMRDLLQEVLPWALELVPLLMECPTAANTPVPSIAAPAPSVLQAAGAILDLVSLHSSASTTPQQQQAPGLTPLAMHRWVLRKLAAATAEERSMLAVMTVSLAAIAQAQVLQAEVSAANAALAQSQAQVQELRKRVLWCRHGPRKNAIG